MMAKTGGESVRISWGKVHKYTGREDGPGSNCCLFRAPRGSFDRSSGLKRTGGQGTAASRSMICAIQCCTNAAQPRQQEHEPGHKKWTWSPRLHFLREGHGEHEHLGLLRCAGGGDGWWR